MPQVFMTEDEKLVSKLVFMSFLCLWFIVLFTFGLLVYQSATHTNQIDELIKSIEFFNSIEGK
jgi:hypothetical protein